MVTLKERVIQEPKELSECFDCLEQIAKAAVAPGDKVANLTGCLPALITAFDGYAAMGEELKDEHVYEGAGAFAGRLAKILVKK